MPYKRQSFKHFAGQKDCGALGKTHFKTVNQSSKMPEEPQINRHSNNITWTPPSDLCTKTNWLSVDFFDHKRDFRLSKVSKLLSQHGHSATTY